MVVEVPPPLEHEASSSGSAVERGLTCPAFARGLHCALRAIIYGFGIDSFNVGILSVPTTPSPSPTQSRRSSQSSGSTMLMAKVVSRGHSSKLASDFGCLEVGL